MPTEAHKAASGRIAHTTLAGVATVAAVLAAALLPSAGLAQAQAQADPMQPRSAIVATAASPLRTVTVVSGDLQATRRFYQGVLGMTPQPWTVDGLVAAQLVAQWGLAPTATLHGVTFTAPLLTDAIRVRAIAAQPGTPSNRPGYLSAYAGALGLGFPARGLPARDAIVGALGFRSVVGITSMAFPRADKSTYNVSEVHYEAPDDVLVLGVDRGDMQPVGEIDPALGIGGPAYSSMIVRDAARAAPLFAEVLGFEMRREMTFRSGGPSGGMRLPAGAEVRFQQWFAPGSASGYLVVMDLLDADQPNPNGLAATNRGVAMWSFEARDLNDIARRAQQAGVRVLRSALVLQPPDGEPVRSLVLATDDGFRVEVTELRRPVVLPTLQRRTEGDRR